VSGRIVHRPHVHSRPPLFYNVLNPIGTVWACDCGRRWTLVRDGSGRATWTDIPQRPLALRLADEYQANLSKEPADVGRRELAAARLWFDHHARGVWADLGMERPR
jgi:hypothetical protein